jgi:hypothetical protein
MNRPAGTEELDEDGRAAVSVQLTCQQAYAFFCASNENPEYDSRLLKAARARYEKSRDEAIATTLAIKGEYAQYYAIHEVIKLCRRTNTQFDLAKKTV